MRCEYCGNDVSDNADLCPFCHARLKDSPAPVTQGAATPVAQQPPQQAQPLAAQPAQAAQQPAPLQAQAAQATPAQPAARKPSRRPLVIAIAAVLVVVVVGAVAFGAGAGSVDSGGSVGSTSVSVPEAARAAVGEASDLAAEMSERYQSYLSGTSQGITQSEINANLADQTKRVEDCIDALEAAGSDWAGYEQARAAVQNLADTLAFVSDMQKAQQDSVSTGEAGTAAAMSTLSQLYDNYSAIDTPPFLGPYLSHTIEYLPTVYAALLYSNESSSVLTSYTTNELVTWWLTKQTGYDTEMNKILVEQCDASHAMLDSILQGKMQSGSPSVNIDAIEEIAPNLYPSLDSAVNLGVTSYDDSRSIIVRAEVTGFTQTFEQKYDLEQGYCYLPVKPSLLTTLDTDALANNSTTQLDVKVTDAETGEVLAQASQQVNLLSMYDFSWYTDEFGSTVAFDIMAWLRPQASEVNALNRQAASILGKWTGGKYTSIAGYQYGTDVIATLLQATAIQQAISDAGVVYVMDSYSFLADQHVFTPEQVVQRKQGLCIETSLLLASCLMSANMHPMIIITPGHAQVAVETYRGSGNYFLLETTTLPFAGVNTSSSETSGAFYNGFLARAKTDDGYYYWTTSGSSEEWEDYFEYKADGSDEFGGIFVIDCSLQKIMGIQGLENI